MSEHRVEKALEASDTEGVLAQITGGVVDHYLAPCALFLGASAAQAAWLSGLPRLANAATQLASEPAARAAGGRRRVLVWGAALQGAVLLPVMLAALRPSWRGALPAVFAAAVAFQALGGLMYPAWASLLSEYLPEERRAGWFGRRSRLLAVWGMGTLALWGLTLDSAGALRSAAAFGLLFAAAAACRLASTAWMAALVHRPEAAPAQDARPWRSRLDGPFARLTLYAALAGGATQLCDSLQAVRLLSVLRFSYRQYMLVRVAAGLGQAAAYAAWGRRADRHGPAAPLRAAGLLMTLAPLAWAFSARLWPLFLFELFDGAASAGFSLCAANHLYDAVPAESRQRAIGLYNLACGAAVFGGAGLAGLLVARGVPPRALFCAAAALRLGVELSLGSRLREVRRSAARPLNLLGVRLGRLFALAPAAGDAQ